MNLTEKLANDIANAAAQLLRGSTATLWEKLADDVEKKVKEKLDKGKNKKPQASAPKPKLPSKPKSGIRTLDELAKNPGVTKQRKSPDLFKNQIARTPAQQKSYEAEVAINKQRQPVHTAKR